MTEFAYNNAKNANTGHTPFKLNCGYHPHVSLEKKIDTWSRSRVIDQIAAKLRVLMTMRKKNLQHAQKLKRKPMRGTSSLEAMPSKTKFDYKANISKPNKIKYLRQNPLAFSESYT